MTIPQASLLNADPTLQDVLNAERRRLKFEFNCHAIAQIVAFNPVNQTASVALVYQQIFYKLTDPITLTYIPYPVPYPVLVNAPVQVAGGGGAAGAVLTFPYGPGDECMVLFNDRDIDNWWATGTPGGPPATARLHSFSDALVIVGFRSQPRVIPSYDPTFAGLRSFSGSVQVGIDVITELARIATETGGTLGVQIQTLIASLTTFATSGATASAALVAASTGPLAPLVPGFTALEGAFTALGTALATSATGFAEVLE